MKRCWNLLLRGTLLHFEPGLNSLLPGGYALAIPARSSFSSPGGHILVLPARSLFSSSGSYALALPARPSFSSFGWVQSCISIALPAGFSFLFCAGYTLALLARPLFLFLKGDTLLHFQPGSLLLEVHSCSFTYH